MNSDEWARRGSSFGSAAEAYAEHRPDYPAEAVLWCVAPIARDGAGQDTAGREMAGEATVGQEMARQVMAGEAAARRDVAGEATAGQDMAGLDMAGLDVAGEDTAGRDMAGLRVLDLGAGTGKLTALLVALGADVTAVEPDGAMRSELRRGLPGVPALSGSAEAIPLPDGSVDAVLCGQAMHWFDMSRAVPEIARVLVPGGTLGAMWNADDDRVAWVAGLQKVTKGAGSPSLSRWRAVADYFAGDQFGTRLFTPVERAEFANSAVHTADSYVALLATHSQILVMEPAEREQVLTRAREYLASRPETADGEFELPMVTSVVRTRRR